ncbi:MAG: hypothetical protein ACI39Q_04690 [Wujia sp.]
MNKTNVAVKKNTAAHTDVAVKKNSGMTIVEIMVGFLLLILMLGMLSGIIAVATNIYYKSVDLRRAEESLQKEVYSNSSADKMEKQEASLALVPAEGMPDESVPIPLKAGLYKLSSRAVLNEADADTLDIELFFLRSAEDTEGTGK